MKLLDCTLRDGGYYNFWDFSEDFVSDYLDLCGATGIDIVEVGLRSPRTAEYRGPYFYSPFAYLEKILEGRDLTVAIMVNAKDALSVGVDKLLPAEESSNFKPEMIRLACTPAEVFEIAPLIEALSTRGFEVVVNVMQALKLTDDELQKVVVHLDKLQISVIYFADSFGSGLPEDIERIFRLAGMYTNKDLGFHAHDNMTMAHINAITAMRSGASYLDSTFLGMGRGAGNAKTEFLLEYFERLTKPMYVEVLDFLSKRMQPLYREFKWGSSLFYFTSGAKNIHPTKIQLLDTDKLMDTEVKVEILDGLKNVNSVENCAKEGCSFEESGLQEFIGRPVLLLGGGESVSRNRLALEEYIGKSNCVVISVGPNLEVDPSFVDIVAVGNPNHMRSEWSEGLDKKTILISAYEANVRSSNFVYYPVDVHEQSFVANDKNAIMPSRLSSCYALCIAMRLQSSEIALAGFDGYDDHLLTARLDEYWRIFNESNLPQLTSLFQTKYKLRVDSVYKRLLDD